MKLNYHNRKFKSISNSGSGEVDETTIFHYQQEENILKATYRGGSIVAGQMLGKVLETGAIEFNYQHINCEGVMKSGYCHSIPEIMSDGLIQLHESWQWMDGKKGVGKSIIVEIKG